MVLKIKKLRQDANLPGRATGGSAGYDLRAYCDSEGLILQPEERRLVPTGIAIELPDNSYVALVFARSGLALKKGLVLANAVGVVDSDYRGELSVALVNNSKMPVYISNGERIAQMVIMPVVILDMLEVVDELSETSRGVGGFGSSGVK